MADILLASGSLNYSENGAAIALSRNASLSGFEGLANFDGYGLTASLSNGLNSDRLEILANGNLKRDGRGLLFSQNGVDTSIGSFEGGLGTAPLRIHFNAAATAPAVLAVLEGLNYFNTSEALVSGDRSLTLNLANGNSSTPTATVIQDFSVTAVDDAVQVLNQTVLFDGSNNVTPDAATATANGAWFYNLDLTKVPADYPIIELSGFAALLAGRNEIDVRGQAIQGIASLTADSGLAMLSSDLDAYAGISNYRLNYDNSDTFDEIVNVGTATAQFDLEIEPLRADFPVLDRTTGYQLSFTSQLISESRTAASDKNGDGLDDRAGFSVIAIGNDKKGIELGFWSDRIWAQNDGKSQQNPSLEPDSTSPQEPLRTFFTQGEGVSFNTQQETHYDLSIQGDTYQLLANGSIILSGSLRDYSDFNPGTQVVPDSQDQIPVIDQIEVFPPNPYAQENFVFFGDNTPTAAANVKLRDIAVHTATTPEILLQPGASPTLPQLSLADLDGPSEQFIEAQLAVDSGTLTVATDVAGGVDNDRIADNGTNQVTITGSLEQINQTLAANNLSYADNNSDLTAVPLNITTRKTFRDSLTLLSRTGSAILGDGSIDGANETPLYPLIRDQGWQIATTGEFFEPGKTDALWRHAATGQLVMWHDISEQSAPDSNEPSLLSQQAMALPTVTDQQWDIKGTADLNSDDKLDVLWYNAAESKLAVWYMDGATLLSKAAIAIDPSIASQLQGYTLQGIGNFQGNASSELLWSNANGDVLLSFFNATASGLSTNLIESVSQDISNGFSLGEIGDYNRDGKDDIAWLTGNAATPYQIWQMNGATVQQTIEVTAL